MEAQGVIWRLLLAALLLHLALIQPNHATAMTWGTLRWVPLELPILLLVLPLLVLIMSRSVVLFCIDLCIVLS